MKLLGLDDLNLRESIEFEKTTGISVGRLLREQMSALAKKQDYDVPMDAFAGLIWMSIKRDKPKTTYKQVLEKGWLDFEFDDEDEVQKVEDPTNGSS